MKKLCRFDVIGLACCPWKASQVFMKTTKDGRRFKSAAKDKTLVAWQEYVKLHAREAMADLGWTGMWTGPVWIKLEFFARTPKGRIDGDPWFNGVAWNAKKEAWVKTGKAVPDLDNLFKATQDALESIVFANDVQSVVINASRRYGPDDGVRVTVYAIEDADLPHFREAA